jgi:hypothetical protein
VRKKIKKFPLWAIALVLFVTGASAISWVPVTLKEVSFVESSVNNGIKATTASSEEGSAMALFNEYVNTIYSTASLEQSSLDIDLFRKVVIGYYNLKQGQFLSTGKSLITIVDFNKPSTEKRLWIIDLENKKLLFHTLVAHGQGSGVDMAENFSNTSNSNQSSLGFYIANETYAGKHGMSLRLDGMDEGFNTNARARGVVVHGADYVSESFIAQHGRLGRSWGCPALPPELTSTIINTIKGKTLLYIAGPSTNYSSAHLDEQIVMNSFSPQNNTLQASL